MSTVDCEPHARVCLQEAILDHWQSGRNGKSSRGALWDMMPTIKSPAGTSRDDKSQCALTFTPSPPTADSSPSAPRPGEEGRMPESVSHQRTLYATMRERSSSDGNTRGPCSEERLMRRREATRLAEDLDNSIILDLSRTMSGKGYS